MSLDQTPQPSTPRTEAAHWFTRRRGGSLSAKEARDFEVWLAQSSENRGSYEELDRMWSIVGQVEDDPDILDMRDKDERAALHQARWQTLGALAAVMSVIVIGGWGLMRAGALPQIAWFEPTPAQEFSTTLGQRATVTLLDQSVVMLDTNTALKVRMSGGKRLVELERGRAFFKVAKDRRRPFIVAANGKTVRATGTAFDVRMEQGRFEVVLAEGRVRVEDPRAKRDDPPGADMRAGWRLAVGEDARWRIEPVDIQRATSWHDGRLSFYYHPLADAVAEMNRYSARKIVFKGEIPQTVVIGNFRAGDVENFVRAVELYKLARVVSNEEDHIELAAR